MVRRTRNPHYGMMVTDATGLWMLIAPRFPVPMTHNETFVWFAVAVPAKSMSLFVLFLDPDQFGEVE